MVVLEVVLVVSGASNRCVVNREASIAALVALGASNRCVFSNEASIAAFDVFAGGSNLWLFRRDASIAALLCSLGTKLLVIPDPMERGLKSADCCNILAC